MTDKPTVNDMMAAYAEDAVDFAKNNFNLELDYSESSVELVESMAAQLYDSLPRGMISGFIRKVQARKISIKYARCSVDTLVKSLASKMEGSGASTMR
jgi:hypothetical protein